MDDDEEDRADGQGKEHAIVSHEDMPKMQM